MALRFLFFERTAARFAAVRFTLLRFFTLRFVRFERRFAIPFLLCEGGSLCGAARTSTQAIQSLSFSFCGRYSSVMKEMPRRDSASSSYFTPERIISRISCCHCFAWNHG